MLHLPLAVKNAKDAYLILGELADIPSIIIAGEPAAGKTRLIGKLPFAEELPKLPTRGAREDELRDTCLSWQEIVEMDTPRAEGNPLPASESFLDWSEYAEQFGGTILDIDALAQICQEHLTIYDFKLWLVLAKKILKGGRIPVLQASPFHLEFLQSIFRNCLAFRLLTHPEIRVERINRRYRHAIGQEITIRDSRIMLTLTSGTEFPRPDSKVILLRNDFQWQLRKNAKCITKAAREKYPEICCEQEASVQLASIPNFYPSKNKEYPR